VLLTRSTPRLRLRRVRLRAACVDQVKKILGTGRVRLRLFARVKLNVKLIRWSIGLDAILGHPLALVGPAVATDTTSHIRSVGSMLEVVAACRHESSLERRRPRACPCRWRPGCRRFSAGCPGARARPQQAIQGDSLSLDARVLKQSGYGAAEAA
jgi:hypothetical protein